MFFSMRVLGVTRASVRSIVAIGAGGGAAAYCSENVRVAEAPSSNLGCLEFDKTESVAQLIKRFNSFERLSQGECTPEIATEAFGPIVNKMWILEENENG